MDIQLLTDVEKASIGERQPLPERYLGLSDDEMDERIGAAKRTLGERVVILGHHYQRDEVIKFADYTGDSLKLSRAAASRGRAAVPEIRLRILAFRCNLPLARSDNINYFPPPEATADFPTFRVITSSIYLTPLPL